MQHSFVLAMLLHTREIIFQVANEQRFGCQCTNPPEHLYSIKLEVYVKDVCAQSLSNRLKWLLLVFCQIKRNFSDYKCDFFNSPTANFLGIISSCFLEGLPTTKSSVFVKAWRIVSTYKVPVSWPEMKIRRQSTNKSNSKFWDLAKIWKWPLCLKQH